MKAVSSRVERHPPKQGMGPTSPFSEPIRTARLMLRPRLQPLLLQKALVAGLAFAQRRLTRRRVESQAGSTATSTTTVYCTLQTRQMRQSHLHASLQLVSACRRCVAFGSARSRLRPFAFRIGESCLSLLVCNERTLCLSSPLSDRSARRGSRRVLPVPPQ